MSAVLLTFNPETGVCAEIPYASLRDAKAEARRIRARDYQTARRGAPTGAHKALMVEYHAARQAWWEAAEYETQLRATELAEYKETHPMPLLRDWLINRKEVVA